MSAEGSQIWICTVCESSRQYGTGFPEDVTPHRLSCRYCQKATPHKFSHVDHEERKYANA